MTPVRLPVSKKQLPRERFWSFAFLWAPGAAFLAILFVAFVVGRRPVWFSVLATLVMVACMAVLIHAISILRRSCYEGRAGLLLLNSLALVGSCLFSSPLVVALIAELKR